MSETTTACKGCIANGWEQDCNHSHRYWPVAYAIAQAIHGEDATDEQGGWFTDDAEQVAADVLSRLGDEPLRARNLEAPLPDIDRHAILLNDRLVIGILGTNDGSGETITDIVADLAPTGAPE